MTGTTTRRGWGANNTTSNNTTTSTGTDARPFGVLQHNKGNGNNIKNGSTKFRRSFQLFAVLVSTLLIVSVYSSFLLIVSLKSHHATTNSNTAPGSGTTTSTAKTKILPPPPSHPNWRALQEAGLVDDGTKLISEGDGFNVIQIGAHFGFEPNDPLGAGIKYILDHADTLEQRKKVRWTFVEPSPTNMRKLSENLIKYGDMCDMRSINVGVVSDSLSESEKTGLVFYSIRDSINLDTGYDSISGKIIPHWITELSSFDRANIMKHSFAMEELGLDLNDYVVETVVKVKGFTDLVKEAVGDAEDVSVFGSSSRRKQPNAPLVVMIDTEGLDCKIVNGISPTSEYLPKYLVFEISHCDYKPSVEHLKAMGYDIKGPKRGNIVAVKKN